MAITFFGASSVPADNGTSALTQTTITPPTSMQLGDLVVVHCTQRGTGTWSVGVTGGQTWGALGANTTTANVSAQTYWARYNGTWSANPRFNNTSGTNTTAVMLVFRPTATNYLWDWTTIADNNVAANTLVTISSTTTTTASSVVLAIWSTADDNTWGNLTGTGWSKTSLSAQYRNLAGNDSSSTFAYDISTAIETISAVSQNQLTLGADATFTRRVTFYEFIPAATNSNFFAFFN